MPLAESSTIPLGEVLNTRSGKGSSIAVGCGRVASTKRRGVTVTKAGMGHSVSGVGYSVTGTGSVIVGSGSTVSRGAVSTSAESSVCSLAL